MSPNIILLFGGDSDERLVSIASAQSIAQTIPCAKLWFWHKNGPIFEIDYQQLSSHLNPFTNELEPKNKPIFNDINQAIASPLSHHHVFFLALHGGQGENGQLQEVLENFHRPYTGSNAKSSHIAFNKILTKEHLAKRASIKMAPHVILDTTMVKTIEALLKDFVNEHGEVIVKPISGGSSLGCFFIRSISDISKVALEILAFSPRPFLAEKLIRGREITVGVVEKNGDVIGLPATEILVDKHGQFDYQGKYLGAAREVTPALLTKKEMHEAQQLAVLAHSTLSLAGYSRSDFMFAEEGFYFLEINTLPGLSKQSLVPQQLAAASISLKEFLNLQIDLAISRTESLINHKEIRP